MLDTGYDATHPDLAGRVPSSGELHDRREVVDGNGHGTHVASTIAGTGAAPAAYKGVAPGADLLVGKVLDDDGFGQDSWVIAGMEWAVAQGADVVNMSLGGEAGRRHRPLSRAINELSATSRHALRGRGRQHGGSGPTTVTAPGAADAALTVGAVDDADTSRTSRAAARGSATAP